MQAKEKLTTAEEEFTRLSNGTPYPSEENIAVEQENLAQLAEFHGELREFLSAGQIRPVPMERAEFPERLERLYRELRDIATNRSVRLPPDFYFGFGEYVDRLPEEVDIPRLTVQVEVVEAVCKILFSNDVASIESITREVFEKPVAGDGGIPFAGGGFAEFGMTDTTTAAAAAVPDEADDGLFSKEHLEVLFSAPDGQVWEVLDALGSSPLFTVVTALEIESPGMGQGGMSGGEGRVRSPERFPTGRPERFPLFGEAMPSPRTPRPRPTGRPSRGGPLDAPSTDSRDVVLPHEERIVAGRDDRATVQLALDVYRFHTGAEEEESPAEMQADSEEEAFQ